MGIRATHTWSELIDALYKLRGVEIHSGIIDRLKFKLTEVSEKRIYIYRYISSNEGEYVDLTRSFHVVHDILNNTGKYTTYSDRVSRQYKHRRFVLAILRQCPLFIVTYNSKENTYEVRYSDDTTTDQHIEEKKRRVVAIVGAGAAIGLGPEGQQPSSHYLTEQLLKNTDDGKTNLLQKIKKTFPNKYKDNFEAYFHVVEQLASFYPDWKQKGSGEYIVQHPLSPFINPTKVFKLTDKQKSPNEVLKSMYMELMSLINVYNTYFEQEKNNALSWYTNFWKGPQNIIWDIFTFNYDTTIETSLQEYIDGYYSLSGDYQHFEPQKYIDDKKNSEKHTINHVHGCLLYSGEKPNFKVDREIQEVYSHNQFKWKDFQTNLDNITCRSLSAGRGQSGDLLVQDSIITGLHKTDKIVSQPFSFYRTQMDVQLIENDSLLIVGYSFNDYYVNNLLESLTLYHNNYRVAVIDFLVIEQLDSQKEYAIAEYFYNHKERAFMNHFFERLLQDDAQSNVWEGFDYSHVSEHYLTSKNGKVMFHIGGFKEAARHKEQIYEFLTANK
ncbi:MAG: SIR2 family protein [Paludibacteraceae bacterium]|nr:SIR2 family protein [Paludibacteraceae bacterium]